MRVFTTGILFFLMLSVGCTGYSGTISAQAADAVSDEAKKHKQVIVLPETIDSLRRFSQVLNLIERTYVKDVKQSDLVNGALKGMLQGLDPHSSFLSPEEYKEMKMTTSGEFFGIGIEITMENNQVTVVAPIDDTPAFKAGMKTGDVIISINGQPTQELSLQEVVSRIRGPKGTEVELTVLRAEEKKPLTLRLVRDAIPLVSVKTKCLEEGYYWVRVTRFSEKTTEELVNLLNDAKKQGPIKGIVLDLRNNPGGLLKQAIGVSDVFLGKGPVVSIKGRSGANEQIFSSLSSADDIHAPMVVLINSGSASASEIVAGALRDRNRAVTIGERSFGKGSVQNIIPLSDDSAVKITVALYYTPNGSSIQAEGIVPDIEIPFEAVAKDKEKTKAANSRFLIRERDLNRHLENKNKKKAEEKKPEEKKKEVDKKVQEQLDSDNQLRMALQIVKGLPKMQAVKN